MWLVYKTTSHTIVKDTCAGKFGSHQCANIYKNLPPQHEKTREESMKNGFHKSMTCYLLLCYQCFLLLHQQAPSIQWQIECGCFLFSLPCATENTLTRVRGRLIRQTVWVGWAQERLIETDSEWQKALITIALFKCVCNAYLDIGVKF